MIARYSFTLVAIFALSLASTPFADGAEQVTVVVVPFSIAPSVNAHPIIAHTLTDFLPDKHQRLVLVGGPEKNKATREVAGDNWPKLSQQGFILRSFDAGDRRGVIVAGDSPAATYWAVCELGHRFGIRYVLREDIYPDKQPLDLTGLDVVMEPELQVRAWQTLGDGVTGPESWSVADQKKLLGQLAKMKFNHVILSVRPWQPFVEYSFRGVSKQSAALWRGEQYPIPRDAPGRTAFAAADSFVNPDFAGQQTHDEMTAAGIKHVRGIISAAKRLGMSVGLELSPLEFPREFEPAIPGLVVVAGTSELAVRPGLLEAGAAAVARGRECRRRFHFAKIASGKQRCRRSSNKSANNAILARRHLPHCQASRHKKGRVSSRNRQHVGWTLRSIKLSNAARSASPPNTRCWPNLIRRFTICRARRGTRTSLLARRMMNSSPASRAARPSPIVCGSASNTSKLRRP